MSVCELQNINFSQLPLAKKIEVKLKGRPLPDLNLTQPSSSRNTPYLRKFNSEIYAKYLWLCGCEQKNALFCFPCLLFGGDVVWTRNGVSDLGHLLLKIKRHESSESHLENVVSLAILDKTNSAAQRSGVYRTSVLKHNEEVRKNREILSKMIDYIKFCCQCDRGYDEKIDSKSPGVFHGLLQFASNLNEPLRNHFEHATVFKDNSEKIQNELLDCMLNVCRSEIQTEIDNAKFLAVVAYDTTDVSEQTDEVLIFRYENNGMVHERFWGFTNPSSQDTNSLSAFILEQLRHVLKGNNEKLIAQAYDGMAEMKGGKSWVHVIVKEIYPNSHFVHCYAHPLNLIIEQAACQNSQVRIFFSDLSGISAFFLKSPQLTSVLDEIRSQRLPQEPAVRWNFNSRAVNTVYENLETLKKCFQELQKLKSRPIIQAATSHLRTLEDEKFLFWLSFFHRVMPHVEVLYDQVQSCTATSADIITSLQCFCEVISRIRSEWSIESYDKENSSAKRRKPDAKVMTRAAEEICDTICIQARERFNFTAHLAAAKLLETSRFSCYRKRFPEEELEITTAAYSMLKKERLQIELIVLYKRRELHEECGVLKLYQILMEGELENSLSEVCALCKIVLTTPMTTTEAERCFSTLKRIKTFLHSTVSEKHLPALAMLTIESELLETTIDFNEKVMEEFINCKKRRKDFTYKE